MTTDPVATARQLRLRHLPDRLVGQTSYPSILWPLGWPTAADCVRATDVLRDALGDDELFAQDEVLASVWLVGMIGRSPKLDAEIATVGSVASTCARGVQGEPWDTAYSYVERLLSEIDHVALVRGALAIAQVERAAELGQRDQRHHKVLGHARHQIAPVVARFGPAGRRLAGMLAERTSSTPQGPYG